MRTGEYQYPSHSAWNCEGYRVVFRFRLETVNRNAGTLVSEAVLVQLSRCGYSPFFQLMAEVAVAMIEATSERLDGMIIVLFSWASLPNS